MAVNTTIFGRKFSISIPGHYTEGATIQLSAKEARALVQTFCTGVRNHVAPQMQKVVADFDGATLLEERVPEWQGKIDQYAANYVLGAARARGPRGASDPEAYEALKLIRAAIRKQLVARDGPQHGKTNQEINEAAHKMLDTPKAAHYRSLAKQIVRQKTPPDLLEGLGEEPRDVAA